MIYGLQCRVGYRASDDIESSWSCSCMTFLDCASATCHRVSFLRVFNNQTPESDGMAEEDGEQAWQLRRRKNESVRGTWLEEAFHISLRHKELPEDPLALPLLSAYYAIPIIGVYDQDEYELLQPAILIHLPDISAPEEIPSQFPPDVKTCLADVQKYPISSSLVLHSFSHVEHLLNDRGELEEVNILPHPWVLAKCLGFEEDWALQEVDTAVQIGAFSGSNVHVTCQNIAEELNGVRVGSVGPRLLHVHHGRFSPNNCQIGLRACHDSQKFEGTKDSGAHMPQSPDGCGLLTDSFHSFYTVVLHPETGNACVTFHIVPRGMCNTIKVLACMRDCDCLQALCERLENTFGPCREINMLRCVS